MKRSQIIALAITFCGVSYLSLAQDHHVTLHVNPKWSECSFQLDPALTQESWHQFTKEAGLVAYFRPIVDARPMGKWNFELAALTWATAFDDTDPAWNDTFVHPDSVHWLKEGSRLPFPGITARLGITDKLDGGVYFTKNPNANYGFYGGQIQYNFVNDLERKWSASVRFNFSSLYGPEDLKLKLYGLDVIVSKEFTIYSDWAFVSPYMGVSTYVSSSHETAEKVNLQDENIIGGQAMVGAVLKLSVARIGVEYSIAKLNTVSFKIGVAF